MLNQILIKLATIFIIIIGTIGYFWIEIPVTKEVRKIQKESISESSGDNDSNNTENQNAKVTARATKGFNKSYARQQQFNQDAKTQLAPKGKRCTQLNLFQIGLSHLEEDHQQNDSRSMGLLWG